MIRNGTEPTIDLWFALGSGDPELLDKLLDRVADLFESCGGIEIEFEWCSWCRVQAWLSGSDESVAAFIKSILDVGNKKHAKAISPGVRVESYADGVSSLTSLWDFQAGS